MKPRKITAFTFAHFLHSAGSQCPNWLPAAGSPARAGCQQLLEASVCYPPHCCWQPGGCFKGRLFEAQGQDSTCENTFSLDYGCSFSSAPEIEAAVPSPPPAAHGQYLRLAVAPTAGGQCGGQHLHGEARSDVDGGVARLDVFPASAFPGASMSKTPLLTLASHRKPVTPAGGAKKNPSHHPRLRKKNPSHREGLHKKKKPVNISGIAKKKKTVRLFRLAKKKASQIQPYKETQNRDRFPEKGVANPMALGSLVAAGNRASNVKL